jgi:membrane-associated phospholipid phosphatase
MNLQSLREKDAALTTELQLRRRGGPAFYASVFFAHSGDSWLCLIVLGLGYWYAESPWNLLAGKLGLGMLLVSLLVGLIKLSVKRSRPPGEWGRLYRSTDPHSFPSGHAARTFLLCTMGAGLGPAWLGAVLFIWATMVSLARIAMAVHYVSDVLAGIVLGILAGVLILMILPGFEPGLNAFLLNLL